MMNIEYLIPIDKKNAICLSVDAFKHHLQIIDEIKINDKEILFKDKLKMPYTIQQGSIATTKNIFFHITISLDERKDLEEVHNFIRKLKTILSKISNNVQILYDGVSKFYSSKAYPLIYEVENLMRKLITKFMIANVGIEWTINDVPDDVKNSINTKNKENTYLYNIDFIELNRLLFSEKYNRNKEALIKKIKSLETNSDIKLNDLKNLLPTSNWEKYFSKKIDATAEELSDKWEELYELRCKIAHNRPFSKSDYDRVNELIHKLKPSIEKAINNLEKVKVDENDKNIIYQDLLFELDESKSVFQNVFKNLVRKINLELQNKNIREIYGLEMKDLVFNDKLGILINSGVINQVEFDDIQYLRNLNRKLYMNKEYKMSKDELQKALDKFESLDKTFI